MRREPFLAASTCAAAMCAWRIGWVYGLVGGRTAISIAFVDLQEYRVADFVRRMSYSLYLLHAPIGYRALNLFAQASRGPTGVLAATLASILIVVLASWAFYRTIEVPSQRWASRLKYSRNRVGYSPISPVPETASSDAPSARSKPDYRDTYAP